MRTNRTRISGSWPYIVVKKWLSVKPKVYDFSEDELDTESEDGDGNSQGSVTDNLIHGNQAASTTKDLEGKQAKSSSNYLESRPPSKDNISRLRRGRSETLRLEYITNKEIRIVIGTWNVAGKLPCESLDIDSWLATKEPADMYAIGFQEVVPLNAGNVLGAEDSSPIPKWENIIRKALNRTHQDQTKQKSYSSPPSPVLNKSFAANALDEDVTVPDINLESECSLICTNPFGIQNDGELTNSYDDFQLKDFHCVSKNSRLYWPEQPLDAAAHGLPSCRLRRVFSSSGVSVSHKVEKKLGLDFQGAKLKGNLKRVYHSSGNLGMIWPEQDDASIAMASNLSVVAATDIKINDVINDHSSKFEEDQRNDTIEQERKGNRDPYVRIVSKQMVGIHISIWVRRRLRRHINNLKVSPVGVGLMGYMGNKGSVSVSMSLFQTRLCFVCSHLTSGQKDSAKDRRNSDVHEILRRTRFSCAIDSDQPQTIPTHDQIFLFGDLNYRLNMEDMEVRKLVAQGRWDELINSDQLCKELRRGHVFDGWKEGLIGFPPTYKYEFDSDKYACENAREGEKRRSPAWCDRILWFGKRIKQVAYSRAELRLSDHRPVSSMFLVEVEVFNHQKLRRVLCVSNAGLDPDVDLIQ